MKEPKGMRVGAYLEQRRAIHGFRDAFSGNYTDSFPSPYEEPENILTFYIGNRALSIKLIPEQVQEASEIAAAISMGNIESDHPDHDWEYQGSIGMRCKKCGFEITGHYSVGWQGGVPTCNEHSMKEALE